MSHNTNTSLFSLTPVNEDVFNRDGSMSKGVTRKELNLASVESLPKL